MTNARQGLRGIVALPILGVFLLLTGCDDDPNGPDEVDERPEINAYLQGLPAWTSFAGVQAEDTTEIGDRIADMAAGTLCTETPKSITENPEDIVTFGSAPNVLYLGSLIQGTSYLGGIGSMEELPIRQRAPLVIALDLFSGTQVVDTVMDPNGASVQASLNAMIADAAVHGHQSGDDIYSRTTETYSFDQAALSLGLSARSMGRSIRGELAYVGTRAERTVTAFFKQVMFTAYIVPPQTPAEFFSPAFTQQRLDEQIALGNIGPNNLPVYVGRMQYGRMMMFTMTSSESSDSLRLAIDASYQGLGSYDASARAAYTRILNESRYEVVAIGGADTTALRLIKTGRLGDYFASDDSITTAVPLGYTLYNLADGSIATVSETTEFVATECSTANADCFDNRSAWEQAVATYAPNSYLLELPTTPDTLALANEVPAPPGPNQPLGPIITFDSAATGFPFTFALRTVQRGSNLVYYDLEGSDYHNAFPVEQDRSLSIGDADGAEDDNFEILVPAFRPRPSLFAVGLTIGDNDAEYNEHVLVEGTGQFEKTMDHCVPNSPAMHGFLGIIATVPVTRVHFNEHSGGDDIFVRDFVFGVVDW